MSATCPRCGHDLVCGNRDCLPARLARTEKQLAEATAECDRLRALAPIEGVRLRLQVIVDGRPQSDTVVVVPTMARLCDAIRPHIRDTDMRGHVADVRNAPGAILDLNRQIGDYRFDDHARLFVCVYVPEPKP